MVQHTLDEIVRELMIDMGETNMNRYARMLNFGVGGLRELRMDTAGQPTSVLLEISGTDSANLPNDFVSLIRVAICDANGVLQSLGMNESLCLPRAFDSCGNPVKCEDGTISGFNGFYTSIEGYADNYRNGECVGRMFGLGGGNNVYGNFRIDWERNTINFGSIISGASCIVLEYLSNMKLIDGKYIVHPFIIEALKNWIRWKTIQFKGGNLSADQLAERQYYNAERQAKRRFNNHSIQDWKEAFRFANKASVKF